MLVHIWLKTLNGTLTTSVVCVALYRDGKRKYTHSDNLTGITPNHFYMLKPQPAYKSLLLETSAFRLEIGAKKGDSTAAVTCVCPLESHRFPCRSEQLLARLRWSWDEMILGFGGTLLVVGVYQNFHRLSQGALLC
jgi:hypothetical protein